MQRIILTIIACSAFVNIQASQVARDVPVPEEYSIQIYQDVIDDVDDNQCEGILAEYRANPRIPPVEIQDKLKKFTTVQECKKHLFNAIEVGWSEGVNVLIDAHVYELNWNALSAYTRKKLEKCCAARNKSYESIIELLQEARGCELKKLSQDRAQEVGWTQDKVLGQIFEDAIGRGDVEEVEAIILLVQQCDDFSDEYFDPLCQQLCANSELDNKIRTILESHLQTA